MVTLIKNVEFLLGYKKSDKFHKLINFKK